MSEHIVLCTVRQVGNIEGCVGNKLFVYLNGHILTAETRDFETNGLYYIVIEDGGIGDYSITHHEQIMDTFNGTEYIEYSMPGEYYTQLRNKVIGNLELSLELSDVVDLPLGITKHVYKFEMPVCMNGIRTPVYPLSTADNIVNMKVYNHGDGTYTIPQEVTEVDTLSELAKITLSCDLSTESVALSGVHKYDVGNGYIDMIVPGMVVICE